MSTPRRRPNDDHDQETARRARAVFVPDDMSDRAASASQQTPAPLRRAIIYLRVSTKDQASRGGEVEGYSLPAQREACIRKAHALGAEVIDEFVDAGESAKTTDRAELQRMLGYVGENSVDLLIVHKVDRLARNRADDVMINLTLQAAGVTLVSCSENIDETPSGKLLHGIMASIAEFYSRNLGTEALKGMQQKAQRGGTVVKAPIGYQNVGKIIDGREVRAVELHAEQAPLIAWAFEAYASGEWTLHHLQEELTTQGLLTKATPKVTAKPLSLSRLHFALRNRYYIGKVIFKGVEYDGVHPPLVSLETFATVQQMLESRRNGEKERTHHHYLKGTVFCGHCGSRLCITRSTNRQGTPYMYYFCLGRHQKRTTCTLRSVSVTSVEALVEHEWTRLKIDPRYGAILQDLVDADFAKLTSQTTASDAKLNRRLQVLREQRRKLLDAFYAEAITTEMLKTEQVTLTREIEALELRVARSHTKAADLETALRRTLEFLYDPHSTYTSAPVNLRRTFNQIVFERIEIFDDDPVSSSVAEPFATILAPDLVQANDSPTATDQVTWINGAPSWLRTHPTWNDGENKKKPAPKGASSENERTRSGAPSSKETTLVSLEGRLSNKRSTFGLCLKEGALAAPAGFEPAPPP